MLASSGGFMARLYVILDIFILLEVFYLIVSTKTGLTLCRYLFEKLVYKPEYKETVKNEEKKAADLIKRKASKTRIIYSFLAVFGIIAGFCVYMIDPNYGLLLAIIGCAYMLAWVITKPDDGSKEKS
jgi:hypothetical protein